MKTEKPWGHEIRWAVNDKYLGKILYIDKGHRLSKQYHEVKDESIYVLRGSLLLELGPHIESTAYKNQTGCIRVVLGPGEHQRIKPGVIHRFCAEKESVILVEVSTPEIDDVVRLDDDYNRAGYLDKAIESCTNDYEEEIDLYKTYGGD